MARFTLFLFIMLKVTLRRWAWQRRTLLATGFLAFWGAWDQGGAEGLISFSSSDLPKKKSDTQSFKQKAHPLHYECRGGQGQPYIATRWCSAPPELFFSFYLSLARACCFPVHAVTRRRRWSLCMFKAVPVCASLELYFVTWLSACGWTRRQLQTEKSKWVSHRDTCTWKRKETFAGTDGVHKTSAAWSCSKNCKERRKAVPVLRGLPGSFGCVQPSGCHTEDAHLTKPEAPPWGRRGAWKWK